MVTRKIVSLLAEGVRDGAAARAASDYLFAERHGKVSATLNIISVDHQTNSLVITRNNPAPVYAVSQDGILCFAEESKPVGLYRNTRPVIAELPLQAGLMVIVYTDGLIHAGSRSGKSLDIQAHITNLVSSGDITPELVCGSLLAKAVELDENRPVDDTSIAVVGVLGTQQQDNIRRMNIRLPID
jgi:serine phosphatase RsbU (regulator of sigma subunit)